MHTEGLLCTHKHTHTHRGRKREKAFLFQQCPDLGTALMSEWVIIQNPSTGAANKNPVWCCSPRSHLCEEVQKQLGAGKHKYLCFVSVVLPPSALLSTSCLESCWDWGGTCHQSPAKYSLGLCIYIHVWDAWWNLPYFISFAWAMQ